MTVDLIPELHDLGKLVDNDAVARDAMSQPEPPLVLTGWARKELEEKRLGGRHTLEWIDWERSQLSLPEGINTDLLRLHHISEYEKLLQEPTDDLPLRKRILLVKVADHYASTLSRAVAENIGDRISGALSRGEGLHKLWRPDFYESARGEGSWAAASTVEQFEALLADLTEPGLTSSAWLERHDHYLRLTPEDKVPPRDVTSLLTHLELVGKVYRVLESHYATALKDDDVLYLDRAQHVRTVGDAESRWNVQLVTCRLHIAQHPVRVGDMNVFRELEQWLEEVVEGDYRDYVLFYTNDTLWLLLPSDGSVRVYDVMAPLINAGFHAPGKGYTRFALRNRPQDFRLLRWHGLPPAEQKKGKLDTFAVYPPLAEEIDPSDPPPLTTPQNIEIHLCEICQMRHADKVWPEHSRYPEVRTRATEAAPERLCNICFDIRDIPAEERFRQLARWHPEEYMELFEEMGEEIPIRTAWVKTTLNFDTLIEWLATAYAGYLEELRGRMEQDGPKAEKALKALDEAMGHFNPLALMADFTEDYRLFLEALAERLEEGHWQFEQITQQQYKDFYVIRMERGKDVYNFLTLYWEELTRHFPEATAPSPIRLSLSLSQVKYPFYQHWEWLRQPAAEVNLQVPGRTYFALPVRHLSLFLDLDVNERRERDERIAATYLHNLATIEHRTGGSRLVPQATFLEDWRRNRLPRLFAPFVDLLEAGELKVGHLLAWYKLTSWR
jgi:hypothetical protein